MFAFCLSLIPFIFWLLLGYGFIAILHSQRNILQNLLLAPVVGMAVTLLSVFWLNRLGIPVKDFAVFLTCFLFLIALVIQVYVRPKLLVRFYLPYAGVLLLGLFLTGWPLLLYGFDWIGYANNDMLTLSNAAQYFLNYGFFAGPVADDLVSGRDYSQYSWFLYVVMMHRVGNEMLLSWLAGLVNLRPDQIFMPLALAIHMTLISATGSLVLQSRHFRLAALLSCALLGCSALSTQAIVNQLSSQAGGLGFLAGAATLLLRTYGELSWKRMLFRALLMGIVISAMLIFYPEMLPFLALSFAIYWLRDRLYFKKTLYIIGLAAIAIALLLNKQLFSSFSHLLRTYFGSTGGTKEILADSMFPYFFKPIGLAILWGIKPFGAYITEPWGSISIGIGFLLTIFAAILIIWQAYKRNPSAIIAFVMLLLAIRLFWGKNDFALFKIAFYIQPFMLATFVISTFAVAKSRLFQVVPIVALMLLEIGSQCHYSLMSADLLDSSVTIWKGSKSKVKQEFEKLIEVIPSNNILIDTSNFILSRFETLQLKGKEVDFTFDSAFPNSNVETLLGLHSVLNPSVVFKFLELNKLILNQFSLKNKPAVFDLKKKSNGDVINSFKLRHLPFNDNTWLIAPSGLQSIFNRQQYGANLGSNFVSLPVKNALNYLVFTNSELGSQEDILYLGGKLKSFYQLEPDVFYPKSTMAAIGQHFLFQVFNPSSGVRLMIEMTSSLQNDGENLLPLADAVGNERKQFSFLGRGSARVFSPALTPQWIEGTPYLAVDMNTAGKHFESREVGLMKLYGTHIRLDRRLMVGFARNISLVSETDYQNLSPPESISNFPLDLAQPALEYSGVYEDGWVSEVAFLTLKEKSNVSELFVEGEIPQIDNPSFNTEIIILVNGQQMLTRRLKLGQFNLKIPLQQNETKCRIDLRFSNKQRLPGDDGRLMSAKLSFIGFRTIKN